MARALIPTSDDRRLAFSEKALVALLAGRGVQGLGGALVTPAALALLTAAFPTGRPRRTAISAWTAGAAGGGALGFGARPR